VEIDLGREVPISISDLREDITRGQIVSRYAIDGAGRGGWRPIVTGTTIGYRKLDRFAPVTARRVRVVIEDALDAPRGVEVGLYEET
jgi:alpha-L-fucosidase